MAKHPYGETVRGGKNIMYAVIETGGKQYRVTEGDVLCVEKLAVEPGETVEFDKVLALNDDAQLLVGTPYLEAAKVFAEAKENGKAKKVVIFKYKAKKDYRKKQGHRQPYTMVEITGISADGKAPEKKAAPVEAALAAEKAAEKTVNLHSMKKAELIEYAKENSIEIDEKATNAEMIAAIEAALK
jgi:large subunit ribosomal protein L21